jgi:transposase
LKQAMNVAALSAENARLKALLAQTQAALVEVEEARRRLEVIVGELRRDKFGAKSEKLSRPMQPAARGCGDRPGRSRCCAGKG